MGSPPIVRRISMIDETKWNKASDEQKMNAIKVIRDFMIEKSVTKADNKLITDYLLKKMRE